MVILWIVCSVLLILVVVLLLKIIWINRSLDELCIELNACLTEHSNTLVSISSNDRQLRHFAADLNKQLRLLRKQRRQYIHGNQSLKAAVTSISHDLRTPLTAVCAYLDLMEQEEKTEKVERYMHIIRNRVELLNQLTEELFRYSVTIVSDLEELVEPVIVNDVLEDSIAGFYTLLKERGIKPIIQLPQKKIIRQLNATMLSRVLINLITNAVKYSDGDLEISLTEAGEITFKNTASALDQVQVGRLFDHFYTVHNAENSTGLGLEITRTLITRMKGTITAEYKNNKLYIRILLPKDTAVPLHES